MLIFILKLCFNGFYPIIAYTLFKMRIASIFVLCAIYFLPTLCFYIATAYFFNVLSIISLHNSLGIIDLS